MFRKLGLLFTIPDLRKKTLVVLALLAVFRVATAIPVPGVDPVRLKEFISGSQFFGLLNIFSGGVLSNLSIAGEAGRERFNQYARLLTVPLALAQGYALLTLLIRQQILPPLDLFGYASNLIIVTAGTIFLMWLGELITERGIGNGVSLMILAGIVASIPQSFQQEAFAFTPERLPSYIGFIAVALAGDSGFIRQAHPRQPRIRRHIHAPAFAGQSGGRDSDHFCRIHYLVSGACRKFPCGSRQYVSARSRRVSCQDV